MKIKSILVAAGAALILTACGGGSVENTPEAVTKAFVKAISAKDFKGAAGYCTATSGKIVESLEEMAAMMPETKLDKEEVKCETEGDKAKCKFCCASGKGEESYNLVKEDGKWKVDYVKGGMENAAEEMNTESTEMPAADSTSTDTTAVE
jgi:hypothetical protein